MMDPTPLFDSVLYSSKGAVFWPNLQPINPESPIWPLIGCKADATRGTPRIMTIEAGQFLIHRGKHKASVRILHYMNERGPTLFYQFGHGDTDLFLPAWRAVSANIGYLQNVPVGLLGDMDNVNNESFCGMTLLQFHPLRPREVIFAHRNIDKWSMSGKEGPRRWKAIKKG